MGSREQLELALERLYARRQFGIKLGLEPVQRMCELLGHPEQQYGVIHVAGTNGKGSVSASIASVVHATGIDVGLYTSPHLIRFNERICVNGVSVSDDELVAALAVCEEASDKVLAEQGHETTFFEITTVLAFECFRRAGVKLAVIETGLGGRLDATNVVTPLISVITRVADDHGAHLGDTLEAIAGEKAGIIKSGRPVICSPQQPEVEAVLRRTADALQASFIAAGDAVSVQRVSGDLHGQKVRVSSENGLAATAHFPLLGDHQLENLGVAMATVELLCDLLGVSLDVALLKAGIEAIRWPGRCELLKASPCVLADAAHNPDGAAALIAFLRRNGIRHAGVVLGMCDDKDAMGVVKQLATIAQRIWVVPIPNERNMPAERLIRLVQSVGVDVAATELDEALDAAEAWAQETGLPVVVTGSIFLLGEVLPRYNAPDLDASDKELELG
ncbi:MAG: bifunctional folylpolyglutamate synthase/dihydrofolate synthase [Verrucomicrobia bacterium]|nr:bifunctional folylpolyglutamate synthase/dihydrofolate synthase [Verrucomicrobiota bacterium]